MSRHSVFMALVAGAGLAAGAAHSADARCPVVCTTFPVAQITRNVAAGQEGTPMSMLPAARFGCPHDYLLTPADMRKAVAARVLIINGLGLDNYIADAVRQANPSITVIDSSRGITNLIALPPGRHEHGEADINPHLFASPRMAARMAVVIAEGLAAADPAGAGAYAANARRYASRLDSLADTFSATCRALNARPIVTQHRVFDYLARDAGLTIAAAMQEHPGEDPSAAGMIDLVRLVRASGAAAVFVEPQYSSAVAALVAVEAGVPLATLDPVASGPDAADAAYYETVMSSNLQVLARVLGAPAGQGTTPHAGR